MKNSKPTAHARALRLRAEAALENEAPSPAEVIRFFDANPPLTNPGRARYALALAAPLPVLLAEYSASSWRGTVFSRPTSSSAGTRHKRG